MTTPDKVTAVCEILRAGPTNAQMQQIALAIDRAKATIERDIPNFTPHECEASPFALATAAVRAAWPMFAPEAKALLESLNAEKVELTQKARKVLEWWPEPSETTSRAGQSYGDGFADDIRELRAALKAGTTE